MHVKAKMLTAEQLTELVGHAPGGVCPFALRENVRVYLDESLRRFDMVYPACGSGNSAVEMTPKELEETILSAGITVLRDEWVYALEDVVLVGREDVSSEERLPLEELPPRPEDACVIWIDHTPYQEEEIASSGADLQLSGHSHAGQLFPLRTLYRLGVRYIWGDYDTRGAHVYVTSGFGGWYIPFRTEKTCCYDVITLKPSQP